MENAPTKVVPLRIVRARITEDEHHRLKVIAAQSRADVADLVANALRSHYNLNGATTR